MTKNEFGTPTFDMSFDGGASWHSYRIIENDLSEPLVSSTRPLSRQVHLTFQDPTDLASFLNGGKVEAILGIPQKKVIVRGYDAAEAA